MSTQQQQPTEYQEDDGASLVSILDELGDIVTHARSMPMSASIMVNRAEVLDLLDAARAVVPDEIRTADGIVAGAEAVVEEARAQAEQMIADAEARAAQLVSQERVVALATERAEQIVADAEAAAAKLAADANDYCDRQLAQFEVDLGAIGAQVRAGREALAARGGREPAGQDDAEDGTRTR